MCAATIARAADPASVLRRVRGEVTYQAGTIATPRPLLGSIDVGDDAHAFTAPRAAAALALPDSSLIEIGDRTDVAVGALRAAADGTTRTITLNHGALRFVIRHPEGLRSSYRFVTPTGQIAVRGTTAYLISGPGGDQVYCIDCAPGDVAYTAAYETTEVRSGQTLDVRRAGSAIDAHIVANSTINNPAVDQFLNGFSPFGRPASEGSDPTGSGSGAP